MNPASSSGGFSTAKSNITFESFVVVLIFLNFVIGAAGRVGSVGSGTTGGCTTPITVNCVGESFVFVCPSESF